MNITFYGHACFLIELGNAKLLIDPFISGNELAKHINIDDIDCTHILLTHAHQDHVLDAEAIAKRTGATIVSNFEIANYYQAKGCSVHPMAHGGCVNFDFGTIKMVNAIHTSSFADGTYGGNPAGFVIWNSDECIYHAGDTALTMDMKLIPMQCPKLSAAILPVGDNFTMGYKDAAVAADFIDCDEIIACHYDTFGDIIACDQAAATTVFNKAQKTISFMEIGETKSI